MSTVPGSTPAATRAGWWWRHLDSGYGDAAETHGRIEAFGVEGTGSYGAGLARAVRRAGHRVVEVNRGDRCTRRATGKSDTIDILSLQVFAALSPGVEPHGEDPDVVLRAFADQQRIARQAAGFVNQG